MTTQFIRNLGVALLAAAVSISAQGSQRLLVNIPFGFHVGGSMLPSGEYTVDSEASPNVVRLRSADNKSSVMIIANSVQTAKTSDQGKLIFHKYGDEYFLSQIWGAGSTIGRELRKSRRELEVAANTRRGIEPVLARK
jgi:hypothetical protein